MSVTSTTIALGRSTDCEIASDDAGVSDRHLTLGLKDGRIAFAAVAGGAAFVDGQRMEKGTLEPHQQLRIGRSLWQLESASRTANSSSSFLGNIGGKISEIAGVEKIEGFNFSEMFSQVFRKRTDEEMESYFAVGTPTTTPTLAEVEVNWPHPWLFVKIFVLAALTYAGLVFMLREFQNPLVLPGLMVIGSFVVPISLLVFFFEVNAARNVPLYQLLKMLLHGGVLSLIVTLALYAVTKVGEPVTWGAAVGIGLVEEAGKVAALLLIVNKLKYRWTLNGLLFGAAVGTGFAVFESAGYAFRLGMENGISEMLDNITLRGMLCLCGGHVVWCSLTGAALWRVRGDRKFEWSMLYDSRFLRVFALAVAMHATWDAPFEWPMYMKFIAVGFVGWVAVMSFIQSGLRQILAAQAEAAKPAAA